MIGFYEHPCGTVSTIAHIIQCVSSIIVLGITAWAVQETKTLAVIFPLVISVLTPVLCAITLSTSCIANRRRWHVLPLLMSDAVISYLWLTSFIFLALNFNHISCSVNRWNGEVVCSRKYAAEAFSFIAFFMSMGAALFEVLYLYFRKEDTSQPMEQRAPEERLQENLQTAGVVH
ncbi:hypothetical protein PENARI_c019G02713 [Penicillium arizonense]|uniref:MARVEL domain-containing protein n=1 Tax=Penicillium arizonense TaxID=1835702 RepID=A0A1F5L9M6_PENAI|nr:hypothetical protein PENARI_c019G02713 [Penicillium arizonense]OGE49902.1 hypothetical protein PENARI_c019G02713 [Penicillium arizonense]